MSTPRFRIQADGQDLTAQVQDRLLSLRLSDEAGMESDSLELALDDRDGRLALPRTGAKLRVELGYEHAGLVHMGTYTVDELDLEGPPQVMTIRARAADFRQALKAPKTRAWYQTTLGDIVSTIAGEHGYTPRISVALARIEVAHVDQTDESDIHLVTRLARQYGATAKPAGGALVFVETGALVTPSGQAMPQVHLSAKDLTSWRATLPERGKYPAVTAQYHDTDQAKRVSVNTGAGEPVFTLRRTYPDAEQAQRAAKAKLGAFARGEATLSLTLPGRPELAADSAVVLSGVRQGVDGTWAVTRVEHHLSSSGYVCQLEAEVPKA
ncbi:MAG: hypothetical protein ETSY1_46780 (plasmid) [Candidatus Entotheonella factor]|uniref:Phage late control protein n=1 Tax=Entotheonella factor TaxID=1429438 RepID=W4M077_ENTF1|nr:MAG: hypothetical protein ETSY1_46780 [Candidatus Entotheonella factor]